MTHEKEKAASMRPRCIIGSDEFKEIFWLWCLTILRKQDFLNNQAK